MNDNVQQGNREARRGLNSLFANEVILGDENLIQVSVSAPSYISYAHYHNQQVVSREYAVVAKSKVLGPAKNGDYTLKVMLRSQGMDISKESYLTIRHDDPTNGSKVPYQLNGDFLLEVREATPATFELTLLDGDDEISTSSIDTQLFPSNLWNAAEGIAKSALMLTAFVRPRDPHLDDILTKARELKGTYSSPEGQKYEPNTSGYQADDAELFAEVKAIYESVQATGIKYSNPASSLDWTHGQLIRSNDEILSAMTATCLDSTVLFASLLENIMIRPVIAIVPGHAFVGFWTTSGETEKFSAGPVASAEEAHSLMRAKKPLVRFVETTAMCESPNQMTFEEAVQLAEAKIVSSLSKADQIQAEIAKASTSGQVNPEQIIRSHKESWVVVDLDQSRRRGYRPIPAKITNADGTTSVIEYNIEQKEVKLDISVDVAKVGTVTDNSPPRVRHWKSQLLDLSFNNPMLNMSRRSAQQVKLFVPKGRLGEIEDYLQTGKGEIKLQAAILTNSEGEGKFAQLEGDDVVPEDLSADANSSFVQNQTLFFQGPAKGTSGNIEVLDKVATSKIRNLSRASKNSIEETGINNLYITFGSLHWKRYEKNKGTDSYIDSPLIMLPINLRAIDRGKIWALSLDDSSEMAVNETLAMKLYQEWGIDIPALTDPAEDNAGIDIPALLEAVRIAIKEAKQTNWYVSEGATVGTYDFSTFHIWKDLNDNWEKLSESPLVKHLIETDGNDAYIDPVSADDHVSEEELDEELAKVPVSSDGTQLRAVVKSLRGQSFIIQGPPGTGKSQTITNLLARNLQEGKKVLFMSEKPAALQVVKERLDEIRLDHFVLDLHSKNTSAGAIRNQLLAAMDASPKVDKVGIEAEQFDFEVATKALTKYPERLHRLNETHGESVYSTRDVLLKLPQSEVLKLDRSSLNYFHGENLMRIRSNMQDISDIGELAGVAKNNAWSLSTLTSSPDTVLNETIAKTVGGIAQLAKPVLEEPEAVNALSLISSRADIKSFVDLPAEIPSLEELRKLADLESQQRLSLHRDLLESLISKISDSKSAGESFGSIPLSDIETDFLTARQAKLFRSKKLEAVAQRLSEFWASPVAPGNLATQLEVAKELFALGKRLSESSFGIPGIGTLDFESLFSEDLIRSRIDKCDELLKLGGYYNEKNGSSMQIALDLDASLRDRFVKLIRAFDELLTSVEANDSSISMWLSGQTLDRRLEEVLNQWEEASQDGEFLSLVRWANLLNLLDDFKKSGQLEALGQILTGEVSFEEAPRAFDRARLNLLLKKLLDEHELSNFSSASQGANISKLRKSVEALRIYNRDTIANSVVQARTFDPTAVAGKAGALRSEINKQRGRLPIRKLMRKYWETITEITPCVAASPESVARFLDVELAHFDVVVFDEASQLRVPNSVGALGRGKSAIIVGDSKQMPPTNFFAAGGPDDEDEDNPSSEPDVESILTMAEYSKLPSVMLKWHYRSQDESLIAFSNSHYYLDELASFPSPIQSEAKDPAIEFQLVENAEYLRAKPKKSSEEDQAPELAKDSHEVATSAVANTNKREAEAVVKRIIEMHEENGSKLNLGVVTMNESQKRLIDNLLSDQANEDLKKQLDLSAGNNQIFVRSLEKVQGDERDVIIMSIGFARVPDPKSASGYKLPQNFGPLTKAGSERRLNVAVTRARKRVIVFCSFEPDDMRITETSSLGMSGLNEYLMLAKYGAEQVGLGNQASFEEPDRHRMNVASELASMGYSVRQNLGLSNFKVDLAIEHPNKKGEYLLAILLDGPNWRKRPAANDRDILPVGVLEKNMGWKAVERIWMPEWLRDPEGEKQRILRVLEELLEDWEKPDATEIPLPPSDLPDFDELVQDPETEIVAPTTLAIDRKAVGVDISDVETFGEVDANLVTDDKSLLQHTDHPEIQRVIGELIEVLTKFEGPVHPDRAVNFIARCFGFSRVQSNRYKAILGAISSSRFSRDEEGFIYPASETAGRFKIWRRGEDGNPRDIAKISMSELGNAMRDLCERTHGLEHGELVRQTMLSFGPKTLSAPIKKRLEKAVANAQSMQKITEDGDHFIAS